jgi:23S rRNA (uracil1939-C5)-methyltransferase
MSLKNKKIFKKIPIVDIAKKGETISKTKKNEIIFLKKGVPGDIVDVEIYKKKKNFFLGNIINYVKLSKERVKPKCEHFDLCGGCQLQNINYDFQLKLKTKLVKDNLERIADVKLGNELEIVPSN